MSGCRKYLILTSLTIAMLLLLLTIPQIANMCFPSIKITGMKTDYYSEAVYTTGTVQERDKLAVTSDYPLVFKKVMVSTGDEVSAGDVLMQVDKENTIALLLELASTGLASSETGSIGGVASTLINVLGNMSSEQLASVLPDEITAPKSGIITSIGVATGKLILPSQELAAISESDELTAVLSVSESDVAKIQTGQAVTVNSVAFPSIEISGTVEEISSSARKQLSGTSFETVIDVTVRLDEKNSAFRPGYSVKAEIETEPLRQINLLPYDSVGQDESGNEYVYVYQEDGTVVKRIVESGVETKNGIEIIQGVYPSDQVIFDVSSASAGGFVSVQGRVS